MKFIILLLLISFTSLNGQIAIDGIFTDWDAVSAIVEESDNEPGLDILSLAVTNDDQNLYLKIETAEFFDLQDEEIISILIDADNNTNTGFPAGGLGTEITYYFGSQNSYINYPNDTYIGNHSDLQLISLPTVTSNIFEIAIKRNLTTSFGDLNMANTVSIVVNNGNNGDQIPNQQGGMQYTMQTSASFENEYSLSKTNESFQRVMSWNVLFDAFLDPEREDEAKAVITSINPDIIALQEVYDTPISVITDFLNDALPNTDGSSWQSAKAGSDVAVFTRYYLEAAENIDGNGVFLLYDNEDNPTIIYNVHLPCCDNDFSRQQEIDHILSVMRDKDTGFLYEDDTPIIITGDFNMVGLAQNVTSFIDGDVVNEYEFGSDFDPDWDGSTLEDANPYVTGFPSNFTWSSDGSNYNPGKLDWMFYTGSVMNNQNSFVFNTRYLPENQLTQLNLSKESTNIVSDHLPLVVDFSFGVVDNDMDGFDSSVDCDDNDPSINPDATEIANNDIDEDCNGTALIIDEDMDGFNSDDDCDDNDPSINPDATEIPNNDIDEDCDGTELIIDEDMDGFNSDEDCDDYDSSINPDATEIPNNNIDEDCDGTELVIDEDMDGFNSDEDCDDYNASINPDATEIPNNNIDEDCDGTELVIDEDMDGFNSDEDCDDYDASINPDATEIPNNNIDEDCDGTELVIDEDMDGFNSDVDCDDNDPSINPDAAEIANNDIDENCDGTELVIDEDMDGFNSDEDCDDYDASINPDATEIPNNNIDEDCDGLDLTTLINSITQIPFQIYPNPAQNRISIKVENADVYSVTISNGIGKEVMNKSMVTNHHLLDISTLSAGIYFIGIRNEELNLGAIKKLVIVD